MLRDVRIVYAPPKNIGFFGGEDGTWGVDIRNADDQQPCHTAVNLANTYKNQGVTIYSIGYALGGSVDCTAGDFHDASGQPCTPPAANSPMPR